MSYLKLPSQKILAKHLRCCTATQASTGSVHCIWKCQLGNRCFSISPSVWIQGTVVQVSDCGSKVVVDDGTGIVMLSECDKVCSKVLVTKGMYVMAVGSLQSGEACPVIVPIKLQDLSSIDHAETLWPLESDKTMKRSSQMETKIEVFEEVHSRKKHSEEDSQPKCQCHSNVLAVASLDGDAVTSLLRKMLRAGHCRA